MQKDKDQLNNNLSALLKEVKKTIDYPVSYWGVYATLESFGIRDIDALTDYGFKTISDLAKHIFSHNTQFDDEEKTYVISRKKIITSQLKYFSKYYFLGLFLLLPLTVNVISIILYDYGLWVWLDFTPVQATLVSVGTILSFIITGGILQVIGSQISFFKGNEDLFQGYKVVLSLLKAAIPALIGIAILLFVTNIIFPFYPLLMMAIAIIYMVLLSFLLLTMGILSALDQQIPISVTFITGTLMVVLYMKVLNTGIYYSHWSGILLTILLNSLYIYYYFDRTLADKTSVSKYAVVKFEIVLNNSHRHFIYGSCFYLFLFLDRFIAWSAGDHAYGIIWFNSIFELGMDWALLPLLFTMALLEYIIQSFAKYLIPVQNTFELNNSKKYSKFFLKFYRNRILLLIFIGVGSIITSYFFLEAFRPHSSTIPKLEAFLSNPVIPKIYWLASIGYMFFILGLFNSLFFFSLSRPEFAVSAIVWGLIVNLFIGLIFSRLFSFEYSVLGLVAGSVVFAIITSVKAFKFFKNIDYYYYSSF